MAAESKAPLPVTDHPFGSWTTAADFKVVGVLGEGAYGCVHKVMHTATKQYYALKQMRDLDEGEDGIGWVCIREVSILKGLDHPNILRLLHVIWPSSHSDDALLLFELLDMDLSRYKTLVENCIAPLLAQSYLHQMLLGLQAAHLKRIVHRDLKPQNLLIDRQGALKIADWGMSKALAGASGPRPATPDVCTRWYRPPELLLGATAYGPEVDMWSVGCILAEMYRTKPLFCGDSEIGQLMSIFSLLGTPTAETWPGVVRLPHYTGKTFPQWPTPSPVSDALRLACPTLCADGLDLLAKLLVCDPARRLTAKQALSHSFFERVLLLASMPLSPPP